MTNNRPKTSTAFADEEWDFTVIGHRGAAGHAPENTLASFAKAVSLGVPAVELDVHVVDGQLVVIHDDDVDRTTDGQGRLSDYSMAELRSLDAGAGERIPTLDEVFDALPAHIGVNVELKGAGTARPVAASLEGSSRPVKVSSFDHDRLTEFAAQSPATPNAPLFGRWRENVLAVARSLDAYAINLAQRIASRDRIDAIRKAGYKVFVYTVNDFAAGQKFADWGATGVFSDYPDRLMSLASKRR